MSFEDDLPKPAGDEYMPDGLSIKVYAPDLGNDPAFLQSVAGALQASAGGNYRSTRGTGKKAVYEISVSQVTYEYSDDPSRMGGLAGAIIGGVVGNKVTKRKNRVGGTIIGAIGGGVVGSELFKEKAHVWAFTVRLKQRTSAEGQKVLSGSGRNKAVETSGTGDVDFGQVANFDALESASRTNRFNVTSHTYEQTRSFAVIVKGQGLGFSKDDAMELAKKKIITELPGFVFGGFTVF
ncbi:MAG: glycine zipper 2TM domain-containing protein [Planctomycetota bacterium]